jgi:hypothetical protein
MKGSLVRTLARAAAIVGALVALTATATPAFAGTITQPSSNPFVVPADAAGNPLPFTVQASGFDPNSNVYVEQCDGVSPATPGWDPTLDCDLGTSPAPSTADGSGNVTFSSNDLNHSFHPFKGQSPQGLFDCLASQDPPSVTGNPSYTNCQVRVSSNNTTGTSDQVFFTMQLPNPSVKLSCTTKGSLSFIKPLTNVPPKKPKATKVKGASTIGTAAGTACDNSNVPASATKFPVTSGSVKFKGSLPAGTNCSAVSNPHLNGTLVTVKWQGTNPKNHKLSVAGKSTVVVSSSTVSGGTYILSGPVTVGNFAGSTVRLQLALNGGVTGASNTCNAGSLAGVSFTGTTAASSIAVL